MHVRKTTQKRWHDIIFNTNGRRTIPRQLLLEALQCSRASYRMWCCCLVLLKCKIGNINCYTFIQYSEPKHKANKQNNMYITNVLTIKYKHNY